MLHTQTPLPPNYARITLADALVMMTSGALFGASWGRLDFVAMWAAAGGAVGCFLAATVHAEIASASYYRTFEPPAIPELQPYEQTAPALDAIVEDGHGGGTFHRVKEWAVSDEQVRYVAGQLVGNGFVWSHSFVRPQSLALTGVPLSRAQYEALRRQWVGARLTERQEDRYICTAPGRAVARRFAE